MTLAVLALPGQLREVRDKAAALNRLEDRQDREILCHQALETSIDGMKGSHVMSESGVGLLEVGCEV